MHLYNSYSFFSFGPGTLFSCPYAVFKKSRPHSSEISSKQQKIAIIYKESRRNSVIMIVPIQTTPKKFLEHLLIVIWGQSRNFYTYSFKILFNWVSTFRRNHFQILFVWSNLSQDETKRWLLKFDKRCFFWDFNHFSVQIYRKPKNTNSEEVGVLVVVGTV